MLIQITVDTILSHYPFCQSAQYLRGQWQRYVMNTMTSQIARWNPSYWKVNQLFSGKSKLKHLLKTKDLKTPKSLCKNISNKSIRFHPANRLNKFCKEAGFMSVVEVGQYFVTRNACEFVFFGCLSRIFSSSRRSSF